MNTENTPTKKTFKQELFELLRFTLIVLAIVIPIRVFIAQPFIVNGESMEPTLAHGDYLIIDEISYRNNNPQRGEVIVFRFPTEQKRYLIKRVIGLPNETISISGNKITVINDQGTSIQLDESYLNGDFSSYGTWSLGHDEYFVLGDNREHSSDSRRWGVLSRDLIVGKTLFRLFPLGKMSYKPGNMLPEQIEVSLD